MGRFGGHALPGSFFIIFGLWYAVQSFRRYFKGKETGEKFKSTPTYPCSCLCGKLKELPVEAAIRLVLILIAGAIEIFTGFAHGHFQHIGNAQHATMFFFFAVAAILDILLHFGAPLPPNIDYISNIIAFTVEGLLFKFHLYGRSPLDVLLHTLLIYVVFATVVCLFVEMKYPHSLLPVLGRAFLLMVQGTWFWHVGDILYPLNGVHVWDEHDHEQIMIATLYFTWHAAINFIVILLIGGIIAIGYRRRSGYHVNNINMKRLINTSEPVYDEEDASDVEFQKPVSRET